MAAKTDLNLLSKAIADKWTGPVGKLSYGRERARFWWFNGSKDKVSLDGWAESFSWDDQVDVSPVITGSLTLRQSLVASPIPPIATGDLIICEVQNTPDDQYSEVVRLRVSEPSRLASGQFTFQLENDAGLLALGGDSWHFPHDKAHKSGWYPWQVVEFVCARVGIRVVMPQVGKRIKKFPPQTNATPIDVINAAMKHIREAELKTLIRRYQNGVLYLSERHYSPELMTLGPQIIDASLVNNKKTGWATALTVRTLAEVAKPKGPKGFNQDTQKAIVVEVPSRKDAAKSYYVRRYGYVHKVVYAHGATSSADARARGLAHLARVLQPNRTLTITSPYIPSLRRGAYIRMAIPALGLSQIVYVQSISYTIGVGSMTMDVTCGFEDPQMTPTLDTVNESTKNLQKPKKTLPVNPNKKDKKTTAKPVPDSLLGQTKAN